MNKILTGLITGGVILTTVAGALAFSGDGTGLGNGQMPRQNENRQAIMDALDASDYETWSQLTAEGPKGEEILAIINENNFSQMVEAHKLAQDGDKEGAKAIFDELGLSDIIGGPGRMENMHEIMDAVENGDYEAWKTIIESRPYGQKLLNLINEDNFGLMQQIHNLVKDSEFENGREIIGDLGFGGPMRGKGMHNGNLDNNGQAKMGTDVEPVVG